ncbi:hypothetical protein VCB84_003165 [Providencia rettgeri]|uniref:Uncharacterized protein n=1 Tax=Providencia rettgeri TaxID=587 RepID=A0AAW6UFJ3_PRORE|nr:hypothetical protein [Providencia rettgeri]ELR5060091.1 hypothetical protein [Providencia rettgeri]ELR5235879.1 hypothetical protein [Providencia rettgeri]ELU1337246.1 hypothetical protein [Providencia rettgeri]EMC2742552.1 hypothetical protein [Providencia rettgeri]EMD6655755.1 hypothetical protein [Providencia rettgeri]
MLRNTLPADLPTMDTRTRFYHHLERNYCITKYGDVLTILQTDGWVLPQPE